MKMYDGSTLSPEAIAYASRVVERPELLRFARGEADPAFQRVPELIFIACSQLGLWYPHELIEYFNKVFRPSFGLLDPVFLEVINQHPRLLLEMTWPSGPLRGDNLEFWRAVVARDGLCIYHLFPKRLRSPELKAIAERRVWAG